MRDAAPGPFRADRAASEPASGAGAGAGAPARRVVSCELVLDVAVPAEVVLQIAASRSAGRLLEERYDVVSGDDLASPAVGVVEVGGVHGTRLHVIHAPVGRLAVSYRAEIEVPTPPSAALATPVTAPVSVPEADRLVYVRPSRYCPSDHLVGFAVAEFGGIAGAAARVDAITDWIRQRVGYVPGSSSVHDSAEDTLLTGAGTCRDFAHLGVALCRAIGVPARFAAVYAPGLAPMDFHAVFESLQGGRWLTHDATDLAPRQAMVRIATGRDAADAAFLSINEGIADLELVEVTATVGSELPVDDAKVLVALA